MILQRLLLQLLVLGVGFRWGVGVSDELKAFQKSCEEVKDVLENIKLSMNLDENALRQRRSIDGLVANVDQDTGLRDEFEDGDEWYRELRAEEAKSGPAEDVNEWEDFYKNNFNKLDTALLDLESPTSRLSDVYRAKSDKDDTKRENTVNNALVAADDSRSSANSHDPNSFSSDQLASDNIKLGPRHNVPQRTMKRRRLPPLDKETHHPPSRNYEYLKDRIDSRTVFDTLKEKQRQNRDYLYNAQLNAPYDSYLHLPRRSNDQDNVKKNDLSHEADYKLSKIEQDEAEISKDASRESHSSNANDCNPFDCNEPTTPAGGCTGDQTPNNDRNEKNGQNRNQAQCNNENRKGPNQSNAPSKGDKQEPSAGKSSSDGHSKTGAGSRPGCKSLEDEPKPVNWKQCKKPGNCKSWTDMAKRSYAFNPMNEIKLKTSRRLMRKGFGATLPSYALPEARREMKLSEMLRNMEQTGKRIEPQSDTFKLDTLMMNPSGASTYNDKQPTETMSDEELKRVIDSINDRGASPGFIRTKRIADGEEQRREEAPNKENSAGNHFRAKRFVHIEDEIFNDNVNEDIETNDMTPQIRLRREVPKPKTRLKRSTGFKADSADGANLTVMHKLQKRSAEMQRGAELQEQQRNGGYTGAYGEDDYYDMTAQQKRVASTNYKMETELQDRFGDSDEADGAMDKLETWLQEGTIRKKKSTKDSKEEKPERSKHKKAAEDAAQLKADDINKSSPQPKSIELNIQTTDVKEPDRKLLCSLKNEILNSSAFEQLENMLKKKDELIATPANTISLDVDEKPPPSEPCSESGTVEPATEQPEATPAPLKQDDRLKLNITIKASVSGSKSSNHLCGNGTIKLGPALTEDRERRSSLYTKQASSEVHDPKGKRKSDTAKDEQKFSCPEGQKKKSNRNQGFELHKQLDSILTGSAITDVMEGVMKLVKRDPRLRVLLPSLTRNKVPKKSDMMEKNLILLRARETEEGANHVEQMMKETMVNINKLIEKQLRSRACVPLVPDLADYYDRMLKMLCEREAERKKRESRLRSLATDFSQAVRAIDPSKVDEKSRIVKKLLRQYDDLPQEDRKVAADIREDLLQDLVYLRKMQAHQEALQKRHKRAMLKNIFRSQPGSEAVKKFEQNYTPEFLKLLKTAEIAKEANSEY